MILAATDSSYSIRERPTAARSNGWPKGLPRRQTGLRLSTGFGPIIVGTAGDIPAANEVASHMKTPAVMLAGQTSITELKGLLALASLVISNDTGTAHVSAALGVPTVVIFGPTDHTSTRPFSDAAAVVRHKLNALPACLRDCPIDHRCMTRVEVDQVYRAAHDLFGAR